VPSSGPAPHEAGGEAAHIPVYHNTNTRASQETGEPSKPKTGKSFPFRQKSRQISDKEKNK